MEQYENEVLDNMREINIANVNRVFDLVNLVGLNMPRKYTIQERIDPFSIYDDVEYERRYRLSKALSMKLYELIDGATTLEPKVSKFNKFCSFHHKFIVSCEPVF